MSWEKARLGVLLPSWLLWLSRVLPLDGGLPLLLPKCGSHDVRLFVGVGLGDSVCGPRSGYGPLRPLLAGDGSLKLCPDVAKGADGAVVEYDADRTEGV